jgi:hypothetical protein
MIRTPSVSLAFKKLDVADKVVFGATVGAGIENNVSTFATPDVSVVDLLAANNTLSGAAQEAASGDHQKKALMDEAEKAWEITYSLEAAYIDRISKGVVSIIELSGYKPTTSIINRLAIPGSAIIKNAKPNTAIGSIHAEVENDETVKNYLYIISTTNAVPVLRNNQFLMSDNPTVIAVVSDGHRKIDCNNLPSRTDVYLTIIAQNAAGSSVPSSPISLRVP